MVESIRSFFKFKERKTNFKRETVGGLTTFLAMAYILPVNAFMLTKAGMPLGGVFLATAISAVIATLIMGLIAKYPVALAPGMGVNAFFTYTVVLGYGLPWQEALAAVFVSGILFFIISVSGLRKKIINAIPLNLKYAVGAGIGLFIAFVGLKNAGIIVSNEATVASLGNLGHPAVILAFIGIVIAVILYAIGGKIRNFAIIISIVATIIIGLILGALGVDYMPEFSKDGMDGLGDIKKTFGAFFGKNDDGRMHLLNVFTSPAGLIAIFTFLFVDFFDTAGTLMAVGNQAGLVDDNGELIDGDKALLADSIGTVAGSMLGTSTVTSYVESGSGIESGARTGFSSVIVALLFGLSILAFPLLSLVNGVEVGTDAFGDPIIYSPVTAMALVLVGALMIKQLKFIDWDDIAFQIGTFFTILMMVLTFSISDGIAFGFISYVIVMVASKRYREVHPIMYGLAALFVGYLILNGLADAEIIKL